MDPANRIADEIGKQGLQVLGAGTALGAPTGVWSYNYFNKHAVCVGESVNGACFNRLLEFAGLDFTSAATFSVVVAVLAFALGAALVLLVGYLLHR